MVKKKSGYKKICIIAVAVLLVTGYVIGFVHINSKFTKGSVELIEPGQTKEINGFRWNSVKGELLTMDEIYEKYGYEDEASDNHKNDFIYLVVWVEVQNMQNTENKLEVMDFMGVNDTWSNGIDMYALWALNGDDFDAVAEPQSTMRVGALTAVDCKEAGRLINGKTEWKLRVTGWPQRNEFVVPVDISEGVNSLL